MSTFTDHEEHFNEIKKKVSGAVKSYFPVEGKKNVLVANKVWVDDNLDVGDIRSQEDAKLKGRTWAVPVRAELELKDAVTGKVKDRRVVTVGNLPKLTQRLSHIVNGNEWQVTNQFRLKSGVYTRVKENGELEGRWNLKKGAGFSMLFDPESKKMVISYPEGSNVPLYPILKTLGVDDDEIERSWGKEILTANKKAKPEVALRSFYKTLRGKAPDSMEEARRFVVEELGKTRLLPDTTKETLGKEFSKVDGGSLLTGSRKLLQVYKGEEEPDDRDRLDFKEIYDSGDLITERLEKDARRDLNNKLRRVVDRGQKVQAIVSPDMFGKHIEGFFTNSGGLVDRPYQFNPMNYFIGFRKTTIGGKHGIDDPQKVTLEAKSINPSHMGFLDPIQTPESSRIGMILQLATGAKKVGKDLHIKAYNTKTGQHEWINPRTAFKSNVAFPDQYSWKGGKPKPIGPQVKVSDPKGNVALASPADVDYILPTSRQMFDFAANMTPFLQNDQGNRTMVAAKQIEQAVPLVARDAPLVQTFAGAGTFEEGIGRFSAHQAPTAGTIVSVKEDGITIRNADGKRQEVQLYNHFPLNDSKSMVNSHPLVKVGDRVKKGQIIADTSFTKDGTLALGKSLRTAYMPWKGYNFEDGIVISETAAKKLTSEHLYRDGATATQDSIFSKKKFLAQTAGQYTKEQAEKLDDDSIIKPGSVVNPGDVLIGELRKEKVTREQQQLELLTGKRVKPVRPKPKIWDKDLPGIVTNVVKHGKNIKVYVKTQEPADIGDKIVGRHGNKAIVTEIVPDHEMPKNKEGRPAELLMNPAGVPTRINLGQALETAAAKIAEKTGKPYVVKNFDPANKNYLSNLRKELKEHGISDTEELFDEKGKSLGEVLVGPQYIYKLHHTAAKGLQARSRGPYTLNMTPRGGGPESGQTMDAMGMYALLAHGAKENIREVQSYRSDKNDEWWNMLQAGEPIPPPKVPFVFHKFEAMLKGMGVDVKKDGNSLVLQPLTDKGVEELSQGEIKNPDLMVRSKDLKPETGGLFDPKLTGTSWPNGTLGKNWNHIELSQRMPNPVFEKPILGLLGMTGKDLDGVISYSQKLEGKKGPQAVIDALSKIDLDKELASNESRLRTVRGAELNKVNRKVKYLRALKKSGLTPVEAYTMGKVPVLPPVMRPISVLDNGDINLADLNQLYKGVGMLNSKIKDFDFERMPEEEAAPLMSEMYDGLKALTLTGATHRGRHASGIMAQISGQMQGTPKKGFFQDKIIGRRQDMSLRGTIVPEPSLSLDEVAIPRKAAMEAYKPFVVRRLVRSGYYPLQALQEVKKKTPVADRALEAEVRDRPVMMKRDPVLHRYGVQAFRPILTEGKAIKIHPLATDGFNADFDGDKMSAYVPVSEEAKLESVKMFPSHNLFSPSTGALMFSPKQESMLGLFKLTEMGKKTGKTFTSVAEAAKAAKDGEIGLTDEINIKDLDLDNIKLAAATKTTVGRILVSQALPKELRDEKVLTDKNFVFDKKTINRILTQVAREHPGKFGDVSDQLKDRGNAYATGFSFGLKDLEPITKYRDEEMAKARVQEKKIWNDAKLTPEMRDEKLIGLYAEVMKKVSDRGKKEADKSGSRMYDWIKSGARGKWNQYQQMTIAPILVVDSKNKPVPVPIDKSYAEGLDIGSYWTSMHGARMGTIGRVLGTEVPGTLLKTMVGVTSSTIVDSEDCGTTRGIAIPIDDRDAIGRYTSKSIDLGKRAGKDKGVIPAGTLVTPELINRMKNNKVKEVPVRTPLKCQLPEGVCSKCYGNDENGSPVQLGKNVGIIAAHAMGEPLTQLSMDSFHSGGIAGAWGTSQVDKIRRIKQLTGLPTTLSGSATLAKINGVVGNIENDPSGGNVVAVGDAKHFLPPGRKILVKKGQEVKKGESLTEGPKNPRDLLDITKSISPVQRYLTDELYSMYEGVSPIKRRNVETFVRGMTNLAKVKNPGSHDTYLRGDLVPMSAISAYNRVLEKGNAPVEAEPILKSADVLSRELHDDWLARMQTTHLKDTLLEASAEGWKSSLHSAHPIPGMAYAAEFGKGSKDKPWRY